MSSPTSTKYGDGAMAMSDVGVNRLDDLYGYGGANEYKNDKKSRDREEKGKARSVPSIADSIKRQFDSEGLASEPFKHIAVIRKPTTNTSTSNTASGPGLPSDDTSIATSIAATTKGHPDSVKIFIPRMSISAFGTDRSIVLSDRIKGILQRSLVEACNSDPSLLSDEEALRSNISQCTIKAFQRDWKAVEKEYAERTSWAGRRFGGRGGGKSRSDPPSELGQERLLPLRYEGAPPASIIFYDKDHILPSDEVLSTLNLDPEGNEEYPEATKESSRTGGARQTEGSGSFLSITKPPWTRLRSRSARSRSAGSLSRVAREESSEELLQK